jgi:hypothetical protein
MEIYYTDKFQKQYKENTKTFMYPTDNFSHNINITIEFIRNNPNLSWIWEILSRNSAITWQMIQDNLDLPWSFKHAIRNPNVTLDIILANKEKYNWTWELISKNPNLPIEFIEMQEDWDWGVISFHENLTLEFIEKHLDKPRFDYWHTNKNITLEFYKRHPDKYKNMWYLSKRESLAVILANPNEKWNRKSIFRNPKLPWNWIRNNMTEKYYSNVSQNSVLTWRIIRDEFLEHVDWFALSRNKFNKKIRFSL